MDEARIEAQAVVDEYATRMSLLTGENVRLTIAYRVMKEQRDAAIKRARELEA